MKFSMLMRLVFRSENISTLPLKISSIITLGTFSAIFEIFSLATFLYNFIGNPSEVFRQSLQKFLKHFFSFLFFLFFSYFFFFIFFISPVTPTKIRLGILSVMPRTIYSTMTLEILENYFENVFCNYFCIFFWFYVYSSHWLLATEKL